jgi:outer membrane protein assembly factor BamB
MANTQNETLTSRKPLRLWPGVLAAVLIALIRFVIPAIVPDATLYGVIGALVGALVILVWWLFFSRAAWSERVGAIVVMVIAVFATRPILHDSIRTGGMGMLFFFYAAPATLTLAFVGWVVASRRLSGGLRWVSMAAAILLGCAVWALVRTGGVTGEGNSDIHWRWTKTPEERLLAQERSLDSARGPGAVPSTGAVGQAPEKPVAAPAAEPAPSTSAPSGAKAPEPRVAATAPDATTGRSVPPADPEMRAEWPGFRGPNRDGIVRGVRIETDWSTSPPVQVWRRPIGPGWSSFAVRGEVFYTQEQRGDDEIVASYRLSTGEPVWMHRDATRFWESNGGAGPRATPTVHGARVYTFGGTGIVNALDADTGARAWSRHAATDSGVEIPEWGFASSPLVVDDLVVVAAAGRLVAYAAGTGELRWLGPEGGAGYSSPHLVTIDGVAQILLLRGSRTISVAPADGRLLWEHTWELGTGILQPALAADRDVLITTGDTMGGVGMRRVAVSHDSAGWTVQERWTSRGLKPYFNDFVVHEGHAFGFDGSILACIDLATGERKWKGGRYGHGQLLLLSDQDVLLVLSEDGELALVSATPDRFKELARIPALEGKTWNHPVLVGDVLLVRNGEEMAAFRLATAR